MIDFEMLRCTRHQTRTRAPPASSDGRIRGHVEVDCPDAEARVAPTKPIRILSVEDHPVFRQGLATVISGEPDMLLVAQAANGAEAIGEFRRHRPDVTLMHLRLPGTNGTDILIAIRGEFPDAPIIMLSSSATHRAIQRPLRSGATDYGLQSSPH